MKVTCSHKSVGPGALWSHRIRDGSYFPIVYMLLNKKESYSAKRNRRMEQMFRRKQRNKWRRRCFTTFWFLWLHLSNHFLFTWVNLVRILFLAMQWSMTETEELRKRRMTDCDGWFYVFTWQEHRVPRYLVKQYLECVCEGVSGWD